MAEIKDLSATDASNTARFPESMLPSAVNNGARALEGMIARFNQDTNGSVTSSGTNTITLAASSTLTAYAQGDRFMFKAGGTNTGAVTLNVDSVGAKAVQKNQAALVAGDITQNDIVHVVYDGTQFQMVSPPKVPVGFGTGDSPQFTGIELGHASDTTLTRTSAGDVDIEGNIIYRAGGTDVPVADGGTGVSTLTDGGVLLGSGTGAITAMSVLADGEMIVGDGSGDPVAESGATLRTSIGLGTGDNVQFTNCVLTGNLDVQGTTTTIDSTNTTIKDPLIELNTGASSNANDLGIIAERGSTGDNSCLIWDESEDAWIAGTTTATGSSSGNLTIAAAPFTCSALTATTITGSTSLALASGATVTGINDTDNMSDASATTLATSESIKAYSDANVKAPGIQMTFETNTADADQGQGRVHANNSTLSSATVLYIDDLANDGTSINSFIDTLDDPTAPNSALIYIQEAGTGTAGVIYQVNGDVVSASSYSKVPVSHVATFGTLSDGDIIGVVVAYSGNNGAGDLTAANNLSDVASATTSRTNLGVGTGDSPQFTGVNVGHASDTTLTRASSGDLNIEGNIIYRSGGQDISVSDGGTGVSSLTDGGILLGSGTDAITVMDALAKGSIVVGDGATDPVALAVGANNTVLTADSSEASGLKWAAVGGGGYELLSATTCSGTASVALESMEAGYHYRLIGSNLIPASNNNDLHVQIGTSGPSYATSGYQYIVGGYLGTSHTKEASTSASQFRVIGQGGGTATGEQYFVDIHILNPALSTARTHLYGNVGGKAHDGNMIEQNFVGFRSTAEANTAVKIFFASTNIASGTVYFYRIADA